MLFKTSSGVLGSPKEERGRGEEWVRGGRKVKRTYKHQRTHIRKSSSCIMKPDVYPLTLRCAHPVHPHTSPSAPRTLRENMNAPQDPQIQTRANRGSHIIAVLRRGSDACKVRHNSDRHRVAGSRRLPLLLLLLLSNAVTDTVIDIFIITYFNCYHYHNSLSFSLLL